MTPTVTRAPKDTTCHGCDAPATVRLSGGCITNLCPSCLALLAAGPQRKEFEAKDADGYTVWFRSDGKGWVEHSYYRPDWNTVHVTSLSREFKPCLRAIADAIEDGGAA